MARTVTFTIRDINDLPWVGARLQFRLSDDSYSATIQYPSDTQTAVATLADGTGSIELWQNALGAEDTTYECTLPTGETFIFVVPAGGTDIDLSTLRGGVFPSLTAGGTNSLSGYADLAAAVADIGATEGTLLMDVSSALDANLVIPSTLALLWLTPNNVIDLDTHTLTINGPIMSGVFEIFDADSGTLVFNGPMENVYPQWFGATGDGGTDDTTAIQKAIDSVGGGAYRGSVFLPTGVYLISESLDLGSSAVAGISKPMTIYGTGQGTQIVNAATANKATFSMLGVSHWRLTDMLISGNSTHPNDGISIDLDGAGNASLGWKIERVTLLMAGYGIKLEDTNTGVIRDCQAWPSPNVDGPIQAPTVAGADYNHFIYMTGAYVHDVSIINFRGQPNSTYAAGVRAIKGDAASSMGIRIIGPLVEGNGGGVISIDVANLNGFFIDNPYFESSGITLTTCSNGVIRSITDGGVGGALVIGANCINNAIIGGFCRTVTFDATAIGNVMIGGYYPTGITDSGAPLNAKIGVRAVVDLFSSHVRVLGELRTGANQVGRITQQESASVASGGTFDTAALSSGGKWSGIVLIGNTESADHTTSTTTAYLVRGETAATTFTSLGTVNGSSGGYAFTPSMPSTGVIRVTNNGAGASDITISFYGSAG